jgi:hypothetical protein
VESVAEETGAGEIVATFLARILSRTAFSAAACCDRE